MSIFDAALTPDQVTGESLQLLFVPLSAFDLDRDLWKKNAKKHDLNIVLDSINRYGFIDPPKWDSTLNSGKGGMFYGNGRTKVIVSALIEANRLGKKAPRGIPTSIATNEWCIPVKFGVNQLSENIAIAGAIDHNNITMMGGGFNASEIASMWDVGYIDLLKGLDKVELLPVSVLPIDLADLMMPQNIDEPIENNDRTPAEKFEKTCPHCGEII